MLPAAVLRLRAAPERLRAEFCGMAFVRLVHGRSRLRLLRIHGDEETAREAAERVMQWQEGEAWIMDWRERTVRFAGLRLDPNRMFSRSGAERNLRRLNPGAGEEETGAALERLEPCREEFLRDAAPPAGGLWIAVHNNGPGYSIETEAPISRKIHLPERENLRDFFLFTDEKDYEAACAGPYNAVLQDRPGGEDDGSLSRWCAARGVRYVNVETAHGRLERQVEMVRWLLRRLPL